GLVARNRQRRQRQVRGRREQRRQGRDGHAEPGVSVATAEKTRWPTDGTAALVPTTDHEGEPVFVVLAKRTYDLHPKGAPTPTGEPRPLELIDVYYDDGDPQTHTVRLENETSPYKVATDVVVIGSAWAPGG